MTRFKTVLAVVLAVGVLAGCSTTRRVEADVQTFATTATAPQRLQGARYRFDRLPSQAATPAQDRIEALAEGALARVGLQRDDAAPQLTVQASAAVRQFWLDDWGNPWPGYGPYWPGRIHLGIGHGWRRGGIMFGTSFATAPAASYWREVSLIVRDARNGQVVYETRARGDNPWSDNDTILATMFDAALQGFPSPPFGERRISIDIPR